ncbi:hypothetical protein SAMN05421823_102717 [Catalinimonas alkaloidigena]|uniref:Uncharacterized protein n=2 Tax=Catalinimonas alkaloidigena TaxID=1075417 RepID=A0A1G9BVZ7_9BACT|nr:hypothetical protein SAMN05421823_102717 [Catalinimonas alkaloidigena]
MAQDVITDSKGNFIFGVPTTTIQPELSSKNVGFTAPIHQFYRKMYYVLDANSGDTINTMAKSQILFFKANAVNNSKSTLIFDKKTNYSPVVELGYSWGFDSLINPSAKAGFYFTYSVSAFGEYQNFNYYDTINDSFSNSKTNRFSPGIRGNLSIFRSTKFVISLSASYQHSIATDNLTSYQNRSNTFYIDDNVASNGTNDGYFSPIDPTRNYRLSISLPQFWISSSLGSKLPFALTPYYYVNISDVYIPKNNFGIVLSFLSKKFDRFDRNSNGSFNSEARFAFAQAFNIGYNIVSAGSKDPNYFFVSGTFSLNTIKDRIVKGLPRPKKK